MADRTSVILGATSALGQAVARELARAGDSLVLVARDANRLERVAADLSARGAPVATRVADLDDTAAHAALVASVRSARPRARDAPGAVHEPELDEAWWLFYGTLPDQGECERDWERAAEALHTNFTSAASLLSHVANRLEPRRRGSIVVVGSVAGDRGRGSNYVYGSAKGALALFCQGLRNRLAKAGVRVLTVKPGFIDTPMTADVPKEPAALWATPARVARDVIRAERRGRDVSYAPWFWRPIMLIITGIPERLFKRLSL